MKSILNACVLACALIAAPAFAQQQVTQSATRAEGLTASNATAAVNNAVTLTLTPNSGQYVYLCGYEIVVSGDGTGTAQTNVSFTSTNLGSWALKYSAVGTARVNLQFNNPPLATCIKATAAGTAVTIVSPTAAANAAYSITGFWYSAP
jgi:hypothetical protein